MRTASSLRQRARPSMRCGEAWSPTRPSPDRACGSAGRSRSAPGHPGMPSTWNHVWVSSHLMLLDTPALYFRAFYGVPESVTAADGTPVNAVRGLLDMISWLVRVENGRQPGRSAASGQSAAPGQGAVSDRGTAAGRGAAAGRASEGAGGVSHRPARLVACMDADWRPAFRVAALASYKAHRARPDGSELTPAALTAQIPIITEVLDAAGIAQAEAPGYEADDVIGTLAARAETPVDIVTGVRDLVQLINDERHVRVLYTARRFSRLEAVDEAAVTARYDIPGRAYAEFAALRGDPSDGLPGVPGIGAKTAAALVRQFGTVDAMLEAIDKDAALPGSSRAKLGGARAYLEAALPIVRVVTDAQIPPIDDRLPTAPKDRARLEELGARWNLGSSLRRLLSALAG